MMNIKRMSRKGKIALLILTTGMLLMICIMSGYSLFYNGYAAGVITKDARKTKYSQYLCSHDWMDRSGICMKCGLKCAHPKYDENNNCRVCGYHHVHAFENSVCTDCGADCSHDNWSKGVCKDCGYICLHQEWNDDVCVSCGIYCTHPEYENGSCVLCGSPCLHSAWKDGECTYCGLTCAHEDHDRNIGICEVCGECVYHDFSTGVCSCGLTPPFETGQLNDKMLEECTKKGTVKTVTYTTKKYNENNEVISKNMDIYLPYGYSSDMKYDVLIMIHGTGEHYNEWSNNPITVGTVMSNPRNIYDNMIEKRLCRPLIIASVSPMYYGENGETDSGYKQMSQEIRKDILPYIAEHFSTYANGITAKSVSKERKHFGIGGEGKGAVYAYCCGMADNFDLFGNFAFFSGCGDYRRYEEILNSDDNKELDVCCYFTGTGKYDPQRYSTYSGFSYISGNTDRIEESINSFYTEIETSDLEWTERTSLIYNALLVMFPASCRGAS